MAHEIGHIAFNHIKRSEGKDEKIWNITADAVLNKYLEMDGLSIIDGAINIPDAINYDVQELYEKLLKEKEQQEQENFQNQNVSQESANDNNFKNNVGHDNHSLWKNALNKENENNDEIKNTQEKCVSLEEKESRLQRLNQLINKYSKENNDKYLNKVVPVLLEDYSSKKKDCLKGYTDTMKLVNVKADDIYLGKIVNVKITSVKTWSMDGEIVK